jgi:hypothetical protein
MDGKFVKFLFSPSGPHASFYSILIGFAFLAGSVVNYFDHGQSSKIVPSLAQKALEAGATFWMHCVLFFLGFVILHVAFGLLFHFCSVAFLQRLGLSRRDHQSAYWLLFLVCWVTIILLSAWIYPRTLVGFSLASLREVIPLQWLIVSLLLVLAPVACGFVLAVWSHLKTFRFRLIASCLVLLIVSFAAVDAGIYGEGVNLVEGSSQPNVVIVGIDGWRRVAFPDTEHMADVMPHMAEFSEHAVWFEEALTPLARSYPSWTTILTGQFPSTHGVRFNLKERPRELFPLAMLEDLGRENYHRVFAIDERRFANIREIHGFDEVIGPALGAADFLLGGISDSPLLNLSVNTRLGQYLFPFLHSNRAAYNLYRPDAFEKKLSRRIKQLPSQPVLFAVHFELPHWPFHWSEPLDNRFQPHELGSDYGQYLEALARTDEQFASLMMALEDGGLLENAIVVVLSDHGEEFSGDDAQWVIDDGRTISTPAGHATHALGQMQHAIPLVFRRFGADEFVRGELKGTASLADVYPTISELLGIASRSSVDGISLAPFLRGYLNEIPDRPLPVETGFNTQSLLTGVVDQSRLFDEGAAYYEILDDGRLAVAEKEIPNIMKKKQFAVYKGDSVIFLSSASSNNFLVGSRRQMRLMSFEEENPGHRRLKSDFCLYFRPHVRPEAC